MRLQILIPAPNTAPDSCTPDNRSRFPFSTSSSDSSARLSSLTPEPVSRTRLPVVPLRAGLAIHDSGHDSWSQTSFNTRDVRLSAQLPTRLTSQLPPLTPGRIHVPAPAPTPGRTHIPTPTPDSRQDSRPSSYPDSRQKSYPNSYPDSRHAY